MGRPKIDIKFVENSSNRHVTYSNRRNGIMKKAKEITVLCDAKVSLIVCANSGKMHEYTSSSTDLVEVLDQYHKKSGERLWDFKHENLENEIERVKTENDSMEILLRHMKGEDISSLKLTELMHLEKALEVGLIGVREHSYLRNLLSSPGQDRGGKNKQLHFALLQKEMEKIALEEMERTT
ncbi:agamous-like MADS-box protein MADS9 [Rutidosis leptorrhynchoides]|uniref:agamous-like MADS-box protein MADS9 n=1 Tax=Rutidosis leptorrhynchoides TaxID=125765 RepID=UPI003A99EE14